MYGNQSFVIPAGDAIISGRPSYESIQKRHKMTMYQNATHKKYYPDCEPSDFNIYEGEMCFEVIETSTRNRNQTPIIEACLNTLLSTISADNGTTDRDVLQNIWKTIRVVGRARGHYIYNAQNPSISDSAVVQIYGSGTVRHTGKHDIFPGDRICAYLPTRNYENGGVGSPNRRVLALDCIVRMSQPSDEEIEKYNKLVKAGVLGDDDDKNRNYNQYLEGLPRFYTEIGIAQRFCKPGDFFELLQCPPSSRTK